jgi:diacylglycerol O-acyltransferase
MANAARERISGVDTAWLRMDNPTNLMMIVGVMMLEGKPSLAAVKRVVASRFLAFARFRSRALQDAAGAWWEDDGSLDLDDHVRRIRLPGKAGKAELERAVSELASTPLDPGKPLWQFHLVENYDGGSAIVVRIHHCYADGIALVQVMLSLTHETAEGSIAQVAPEPAPEKASEDEDFWGKLLGPVIEAGKSLAANPQMAGDALQVLLGKGKDLATEAARLATMGRDTQTRFKGALGTRKRVAWATPLPLEEVKAVGKALGCSINDVLLSMAAGALRDYLIDKGDPVDGVEIRAIVPVNLRGGSSGPGGAAKTLGNHFGLVFLDVPIGMDHPLERLYEIRRRMRELKGSYQPVIALALLSAVGYGPRVLQEQVTQLLGANASTVMTNVPGPTRALYFAGKRIAALDFWVPQSGGIGMGISILSYNGRIQFGVITDAGLVPDPQRIVERFDDEFAQLLWLTLMSPWGEEVAASVEAAVPKAEEAAAKRIPKRFRNL